MIQRFYLSLLVISFLKFSSYGQCTFTTSISTGSSNVACGSAQLTVPSDYNWTPKANFGGGGRRKAVGFSINGKGYIGTGDNAPSQQSDFWEYNPTSDTWTQKANFGGGIRNGAVVFVIGNSAYVGTGFDGLNVKTDLWKYDPISNTWTQKANFAGGARTNAVAFSIGNKGYLGTGINSGLEKSDFWEYNSITDTWTQKSNMPGLSRYEAVGFSIANKGYVGTGLNYTTNAELNDFWEYDPSLDLWTQKADFAGAGRRGAVGFSQGIFGYIGTGYSNTYVLNDFFQYNSITDTWNSFLALPASRDFGVGFSINEDLYVGTGRANYTNSAYSEFWICKDLYNYKWSNGDTTSLTNVLSTGTYSVIVTNFAGCTANASQSVIVNPKPSLSLIGQKNVFCKNEATGSATVSATGGSLITYNWSPAVSNDSTVNGLIAGTYTCTATNSFGCRDTKLIIVTQPTTTFNYSMSVNNTFCIGKSTGSASVTISGGGSPYTYLWSSGATTSVVTNLGYGSYSVAITDANNCVKTNSVFIGESNHYNTSISVNGTTVSCGSGTLSANSDYKWNQKASFPAISRDRPVAFSIGNYGYVGTGNAGPSSGGYKNDFWQYNPASNSWTQVANFGGVARQGAVGFSIGGLGYVGTGYNGAYKNDFWEYNPTLNTWTQKTNFGGAARQYAFAFSIGNKGYIGGGYGGSTAYDVWEFDPSTNTWIQKTNIPVTKVCAVGYTIGSKGYVGSGWSNLNDFWEYDPNLNNWTQKAPLPGGIKNYAVGFSINNKGYIGTGNDGSYMKDFWEYNPLTNSWVQKDNFGGGVRSGAIGFSIGNKGYMGLGTNGSSYQNDWWEYTQSNNLSWSNAANTQTIYPTSSGIYSITAVAPDGCIGTSSISITVNTNPIVNISPVNVSCNGESSGSASAIINGGTAPYSYLWSTGATTSVITNLATGSYSLSVTDINNCMNNKTISITQPMPLTSSISVSGSTISCGNSTFTAVCDAIWTQKANFGAGTRAYAVGFSIDGKGYVGTGYNSGYKNDFWEYDPSTNAWTQKANFGGAARSMAMAFSIGTKGYIGTGYDGSYMQDFWEYDPATNTWSQKANFGGGTRRSVAAFTLGNMGYAGTGINNTGAKSDFWEYNSITDTWTQKAPFTGGLRIGAIGLGISGKGYIGTGSNMQDFWEYDPSLDTWTQKANFGGGTRIDATAFTIGSKGYVGTGITLGVRKNDFWEYDPATNTWTQRNNVGGTIRGCAVGFSIGSKGYIGTGGENNTKNKNDLWEYNTAKTYLWSNAATTPSIDITASGNYFVTITSAEGCTTTSSQSVIINPNPPVTVNSGSICEGNSFTITPGGANTYTISGGSYAVSPSVTTNYTLTGSDANGCSDTAVSTIIVNNLPTVAALSSSSLLCTGQTASITAGGASTYLWNDNSNNASIAVSPTVTTTYSVTGTDSNGCSNIAIITQSVSLCTGIESLQNNQPTIAIYPNPTNGILNIDFDIDKDADIHVLNSLGEDVFQSTIHSKKTKLNLGNLNNGIYVIKIITNDRQLFQQIIITK